MATVSSPFSDVEWVRTDLPSITVDDFSDADILRAIQDGDRDVIDDLAGMIDWGEITSIPLAVKRLSHYKACELTLLRVINSAAVVSQENNLVTYWENKYNKLLQAIRKGEVLLLDSSYDEYEPDEVTKSVLGRII